MPTQQPHLDPKTLQLEALLLAMAKTAQYNAKPYYVGGGFAVDLTFGGITRSHDDIDFYPLEADTQWWKDWFRSQGYIVSADTDMEPLLNAFSVLNTSGESFDADRNYLADVYPISVAADGSISMAVGPETAEVWDGMLTIQGERGLWPGKSWHTRKSVDYKGQQIILEDYRAVLGQKETYIKLHGGSLSEKHLIDFERAGIKSKV